MTGFLNGKNARQFMDELWALLLSAQDSESGIPEEFIQQKKDEILRRDEDSKAFDREKSGDPDTSRSGGRFRPIRNSSRDDSRESSVHKSTSSAPSPSPGPRKQSADSTSVPDKSDDHTSKGKRSPSADMKTKDGKISSSQRQHRSRDRSVEQASQQQAPTAQQQQGQRNSRLSCSKTNSENSSKKQRDSEERKLDVNSAVSNIQTKLINIAEGKKRSQRTRSRSISKSRSRSKSKSMSKGKSASRSPRSRSRRSRSRRSRSSSDSSDSGSRSRSRSRSR